ncbi:F0F1 ATP synthase subunit delta [Candidatus Nomurabacteria bacterium]|nr:F0F1 ATP synthase subunit delta [Candidatus Nomurabacteria bacterium]
MADRISRRKIAKYAAAEIAAGNIEALDEVAAHLIDTQRSKEAELVARDIEAALAESGEVIATVTTARKLTGESRSAVKSYVIRVTGANKVIIRETVDPSVIGGVKIALPGRLLDTTVAAKLEKLTV